MVRRERRNKNSDIEKLKQEVAGLKTIVEDLKRILQDFEKGATENAEESYSLYHEYLTGETKDE